MSLAAERQADEVHGDAAAAALSTALTTLRPVPKMRISPSDVHASREGRWIALVVRWKGGRSITVKLTRAWAAVLWQRLGKALGK